MEREFLEQLYKEMQASTLEEFEEVARPFFMDGLTGFYNRHFYGVQLPNIQRYILDAKKLIRPGSSENVFTILFADVNNLKQVNDTKSYAIADEGIRKIIETMNSNFSSFPNRLSFRVGGDEFLSLFPNTTKQDIIPHVINIEHEIAAQKESLNNMSVAIGLSDSQEFNFSTFDYEKASEYFYMLITSTSIAEMHKRKQEIKFGDIDAANYAINYVSGSIQYLFRALGIENPTAEEVAKVKEFMNIALTDVFKKLDPKGKEGTSR